MVNRYVPYKVLKKSLCIMKSVQDYVRTMLLRRFNKHTALFAEISDRSKYVLACQNQRAYPWPIQNGYMLPNGNRVVGPKLSKFLSPNNLKVISRLSQNGFEVVSKLSHRCFKAFQKYVKRCSKLSKSCPKVITQFIVRKLSQSDTTVVRSGAQNQ